MKFYTSYFYAVRHMKPWHIPLSTAIWDPKWFHAFKHQDYTFIDKNGVINGLRAEMLSPSPALEGLCAGAPCSRKPDSCDFLRKYFEQLSKINFKDFLSRCERLGKQVQQDFSLKHEILLCFWYMKLLITLVLRK